MGRFGIVSLLFLFTLLVWASRGPGPSPITFINITSLLVGAAATVMVLIFGSLSGIMCERSGVVNIAIEGQFIAGAFLGSMIASTTNNFYLAAIGGICDRRTHRPGTGLLLVALSVGPDHRRHCAGHHV